jgi:hypothetical protein
MLSVRGGEDHRLVLGGQRPKPRAAGEEPRQIGARYPLKASARAVSGASFVGGLKEFLAEVGSAAPRAQHSVIWMTDSSSCQLPGYFINQNN